MGAKKQNIFTIRDNILDRNVDVLHIFGGLTTGARRPVLYGNVP